MTVRGTAGLLAVLVALGAYLWLVEFRPAPASGLDATPALLATPAAATRVDLERADRPLRAIRAGTRWTDDAGRPWQNDVVGDLLATLATLRPVMVVDADAGEPATYGLGTPERLRVTAADGRELARIDVGKPNPSGTGLYARVGDRRDVVLIGAVLRWELDKLRSAAPEAVRP